MEKKITLFELLNSEKFRRFPAMYLGKIDILFLEAYIVGYEKALALHNIKEENNIFNDNNFNDLVMQYYNKSAQVSWANRIWAESSGDEPHSFMMFFLLFDKFIGEEKGEDFYQNLLLLYRGRLKQEDINFNDVPS